MPRRVTVEILRLKFLVPADLPEAETQGISNLLRKKRFLRQIREAIETILKRRRRLHGVGLRMTF